MLCGQDAEKIPADCFRVLANLLARQKEAIVKEDFKELLFLNEYIEDFLKINQSLINTDKETAAALAGRFKNNYTLLKKKHKIYKNLYLSTRGANTALPRRVCCYL